MKKKIQHEIDSKQSELVRVTSHTSAGVTYHSIYLRLHKRRRG